MLPYSFLVPFPDATVMPRVQGSAASAPSGQHAQLHRQFAAEVAGLAAPRMAATPGAIVKVASAAGVAT